LRLVHRVRKARSDREPVMSAKPQIISHLGEKELLLPRLVQDALGANDRLKLCFTLLQTAERHADHPRDPSPDLLSDREAAHIDGALTDTVSGSRRESDGSLHLPGAQRVRELIVADLEAMCAPLEQAGVAEATELRDRMRRLISDLPLLEADRVPGHLIARITSMARPAAGETHADSLHALVVDMHRALNSLQASLSQEDLDGASVWAIADSDRTLVRAFMSGIHQTASLKFGHPGLDTTATRAGERLVIQNDIGTTGAHVLVLHVEGLAATLIYTDVHVQRVAFLRGLLTPFPVEWNQSSGHAAENLGSEGVYVLAIGRLQASDPASLERYLAFLGSRIVFLIDWNRARKRLQQFLGKTEAVRLLKWAADRNIGHRGFLELGGERLVYEALEFAQQTPLHYGERLDETLGADAAFDYLQFVMNEAATGLLQGRSERFIRDEIKAELARRLRAAHIGLISVALTHAERVFDLAAAVHEGLLNYGEPGTEALLKRTALRARGWEQECDAIVARIRALARRTAKFEAYAALMHEADEAADGLEEAAFLLTHLGVTPLPRPVADSLRSLAALLLDGAQESVKMFEAASHVTRDGAREDLQDFFAAADRILALEHSTDTAERGVTSTLLAEVADARTLVLVSSVGRVLEHAADALAVTALKLRDHLLTELASA
jgi:uncharacterized protein Yka (UPF0111/DUF47 family)